MTIHLYGDSYVDDCKEELHMNLGLKNFKDHDRWYDLLSQEQNEEVINYAKSGEGSITTMEKFQTELEQGVLANDKQSNKVVIVLSSPFRIPWLFEVSGVQGDIRCLPDLGNPAGIFLEFFNWFECQEDSGRGTALSDQQCFTIKELYDCMWKELSMSNYKNICYLSHISKTHDIPMIVFTVYDMGDNRRRISTKYPQINTAPNILCMDKLNSDIFYYYSNALFNISEERESTVNHMSEYNHKIMNNIICNHFYGPGEGRDEEFYRPPGGQLDHTLDFIYD